MGSSLGAFSDLSANILNSSVGNIEHAYLVVFDTGRSKPIATEEAEKLDSKKSMFELPDLIDTAAIAEKLAVTVAYANTLKSMLSAIFPQKAIDEANKAGNEVAVKRLKVQFNPNHIRVDASGSKMGLKPDVTAKKKEEGSNDSYGYQTFPPRITVTIPIIIDEEENTEAFASDSVNLFNATNVAQSLKNYFSGSKCRVQEETEAILSLLRNNSTRTVGFYWGSKMSYVGALTSADANYTMFHRDGSPCRAVINLQILTVEKSIDAGFANQWVDKYNNFKEADKNSLAKWGEGANLGNILNLPF